MPEPLQTESCGRGAPEGPHTKPPPSQPCSTRARRNNCTKMPLTLYEAVATALLCASCCSWILLDAASIHVLLGKARLYASGFLLMFVGCATCRPCTGTPLRAMPFLLEPTFTPADWWAASMFKV